MCRGIVDSRATVMTSVDLEERKAKANKPFHGEAVPACDDIGFTAPSVRAARDIVASAARYLVSCHPAVRERDDSSHSARNLPRPALHATATRRNRFKVFICAKGDACHRTADVRAASQSQVVETGPEYKYKSRLPTGCCTRRSAQDWRNCLREPRGRPRSSHQPVPSYAAVLVTPPLGGCVMLQYITPMAFILPESN